MEQVCTQQSAAAVATAVAAATPTAVAHASPCVISGLDDDALASVSTTVIINTAAIKYAAAEGVAAMGDAAEATLPAEPAAAAIPAAAVGPAAEATPTAEPAGAAIPAAAAAEAAAVVGASAEGTSAAESAAAAVVAVTADGGEISMFEGSHVFLKSLHERYLLHIDDDPYSLESFFAQHLRMGGAYWTFTSLWLLGSSATASRRCSRESSSITKMYHSTSWTVSQSDVAASSASTGPASLVSSVNTSQGSPSRFSQSSSPFRSRNDSQSSPLREMSASVASCLPVVHAAVGTDASCTTAVPVSILDATPVASSSTSETVSSPVDSTALESSPLAVGYPSAASTVLSTAQHSDILVTGVDDMAFAAATRRDLAANSGNAAPAGMYVSPCATREDKLTAWILSCQHSSGGFGQGPGQDPHITSTHYAVLLLLCMNRVHVLNREEVAAWICQLKVAGGGFKGDIWGECDTRYAYCGAACLTLLGHFDRDTALQTAFYVQKCSNVDGGYAWVPGGESHAASAFCCIATLALCERLAVVEREKLASWLLERQLQTGGFNGRPEKAPDVCYSFWILAALAIIGFMHWVDTEALTKFVLEAQDENGGIADRPGDLPDVFHTYFGIAALSLMQTVPGIKEVHPVFSIPCEVARREKLGCCVLWG